MMEKYYNEVKENYLRISEEIEKAAFKAGKNKNEINLLAATKTVDVDRINYLIKCGVKFIGENRVQELLLKYDDYDLSSCDLHFIGKLQTNKIKYIVDRVSCIHSIDSMNQIKEISKKLNGTDKSMKILIEVNIGKEESKGGIMPEQLYEFIDEARSYGGIQIDGLMCIPPICEKKCEIINYFTEMNKYYVDIKGKKMDNINMNVLSMGMSDDYSEAIECGSNMVRVGSALFGSRI